MTLYIGYPGFQVLSVAFLGRGKAKSFDLIEQEWAFLSSLLSPFALLKFSIGIECVMTKGLAETQMTYVQHTRVCQVR